MHALTCMASYELISHTCSSHTLPHNCIPADKKWVSEKRLPIPVTLREAFTLFLDINTPPTPQFLKLLTKHVCHLNKLQDESGGGGVVREEIGEGLLGEGVGEGSVRGRGGGGVC